MKELDDIEGLAAEYVLGTLDAAERNAVAARRTREPVLDAAIVGWERRLGPLVRYVEPVAPPADLLARIKSRVRSPGPDLKLVQSREFELRRQVRNWRAATAAMGALAASVLGFVVFTEMTKPKMPPATYVAMLKNDAASPAFLLTVDLETKMFTIRPVAAHAQQGKSYELWLVHDKLQQPRSLGLVDDNMTIRPELASYDPNMFMNATFAVSLEPKGGSPSGTPTGPVLFSGTLMQTTP